jgi:type IV pilus assembly protein PilO
MLVLMSIEATTPEQRLRLTGWLAHAAGLAVVVALVGIGYALLIKPQKSSWRTIRSQRSELEALVRRAPSIKREFAHLHRQREEVNQRIQSASARIPVGPQEVDFLTQIKEIAGQTAASLDDYRPGLVVADTPVSRMEIGISISGPYANVCRFMEQIGKLQRLNRVVQFEVVGKESDECQVRMTLWIYFDPAAATAVKGANHA